MVILCTIDLETREVSLPAGQVIASYDHNVDVIRFQAETIPGFSLDTSSIKVAAQGPNKARHDYAVDPSTVAIEEETGYITFDWPIPAGVTEMPIGTFKYGDRGQLIFAVCAEIISGSTVSKAWHSDDGIITVVAHLEPESGGGEDPEEEATNAQKIAQLQTDVAVINTQVGALANGSPTPVSTVAEMTDESVVYLYTGSETGYTAGNWYYYNGTTWTSGGTYGGATTSTTFNQHGVPADDFAVGEALAEKADSDDVTALDTRVTAAEGDVDDVNERLTQITSGTNNLFNSEWLLEASGWTEQDDVYSGIARSLVDEYKRTVKPFPFEAFEENTQYTFSLKAKVSGNTGSGSDSANQCFRIFITYSDNTTDVVLGVTNTILEFTKIIGTTAANKTVTAVNASYGAEVDNTLYLREVQCEKGTVATDYVPFTTAKDIIAREQATEINNSFNSFIADVFTESIKFNELTTTRTDGKYISANGTIADSANYSVITANVDGGKTYKGYSYAYANNYYYAFYDSSNNFIAGEKRTDSGSGAINFEVVAPTNATKIAVEIQTSQITASNSKVYESENILTINNDNVKKKWVGKKWVVVGDSLTAENDRTSKHYFDYIADATGISVVNMGASGTGYARGANSSAAFYQRILRCPTDADVVTIFGSFNDLGAELPIGSVNDTDTTTIAGCINTTINNLQAIIPLVNLGIVAPTPWQTSQPSTSGTAFEYVEMIKAICERRSIPFLDLWRCSNLRPWDADFRAVAYSKDNGNGVHPDENGHKLIAPRFEGFLSTLLLT